MGHERIVTAAIGFAAGCLVAGGMTWFLVPSNSQIKPLRESTLAGGSGYKFIDPLIGVSNTGLVDSPEYTSLENTLRSYISDQVQAGNLTTASVLLSDISQAQGFTINPDEEYSPASLLKVPAMIAYYKLAENDPAILDKEILYQGGVDANLQEHFQSPVQLQRGRSYSIEELIEHMIKYSDNNAAQLLINNLDDTNQNDTFNALFKDMGIDQIDLSNDSITVRAYSLFFRILYNATYLDRDHSEQALALLTQTDFSKGIESGVPNNIQVAQKFGEFTLQTSSGEVIKRELHNCGIIYYPKHPYLLCIMTKGNDFDKLEAVLTNISHQTFAFMEQKYSQ